VNEEVKIEINVPPGLWPYAFFGLGLDTTDIIPDQRTNWPVGRGVPMPKGIVKNPDELALRNSKDEIIPRQVRPLAFWPDGSVMFAHVAWQTNVAHDNPAHFTLMLSGGDKSPAPENPINIKEEGDKIAIDNGPLTTTFSNENNTPNMALALNGTPVFGGNIELWTVDKDGQSYTGALDGAESIRVIESGPLVGVVEISGKHRNESNAVFLDYVLRFRFDAGLPKMEVSHTLINMGDEPDGVAVGEIGLRLPKFADGELSHAVCQTASGIDSFPVLREFPEDVEINVTPTGIRIADRTPFREDTTEYPPYLFKVLDFVTPWIGVRSKNWSLMTQIYEAKENQPKKICSRGGQLEYHLWPKDSDLQVLRQGMARTHRVNINFLKPDAPAIDMHVLHHQLETPPNVVVPFEWYQHCEVFGMQHTMSWMPKRYPFIEGRLMNMIERSWIPGMLNYGDDSDVGYSASYALVGNPGNVWINNEHDFMSQAVIQFWRSGRRDAWKSARVSAEHQIDVDFVRKSDDPWKVGGIPAHCREHTTSAVYPSHCWTEGLLQYYLTSGDDRALEVAKGIGRNICKYVEERYQILATESRMRGWALIALDALIEITHDERCLRAARKIESEIRSFIERTGRDMHTEMNYGLGTVCTGLANLHRITNDENTLKLLLTILDFHIENQPKVNPFGLIADTFRYPLNLTLPGWAYAYHVTGKKKYLKAGIEHFLYTGPPPNNQTSVRGQGKCYRTYMPFLKVAHETGDLAKMEKGLRFTG